jgi:hypothetical protein
LLVAHGKICRVQIGMLGSFEVRRDDGALAGVPGARPVDRPRARTEIGTVRKNIVTAVDRGTPRLRR